MKSRYLLTLLFFLACGTPFFSPFPAWSQTKGSIGIQPLQKIREMPIHKLIPPSVSPLFSPHEMEHFLQRLEGTPPNWTQQHHADITKQSENLFQLNRQRDAARRTKKEILAQPIAFLWTGILRQYLPEYEGFSLALGPILTATSWGTIRFKPGILPDYLIAIPTPETRKELLIRQQQGEQIEITIVCIGTLIPEESVIYAFSHDSPHEGMILPVVSIQRLVYVLQPS